MIMAYPKDYRYEPYSDTLEAVEVTECHIIPATSPYTIRLNEVPQKSSPSTMVVKAVSSFSGGNPVYGSTYTEVSATPSAGQYYPDYYTGADEDANWNTGTVLFNADNAGQLVEITYMATGALASLKSNHYPDWWTDRGDGSDGVFAPSSNTTLAGGEYNYKAVYIPSGVTVTCSKSTVMKVQGMFVNNGILAVAACGGAGGAGGAGHGGWEGAGDPGGPGASGYGAGDGGAGSSGAGGVAQRVDLTESLPIFNLFGGGGGGGYGENDCGTRGGAGGAGGGAICIIAKVIKNTGIVSANGANGANGSNRGSGSGGGGGGGYVAVFCEKLYSAGTIQANGGAGGTGSSSYSIGVAGQNGKILTKEWGVL